MRMALSCRNRWGERERGEGCKSAREGERTSEEIYKKSTGLSVEAATVLGSAVQSDGPSAIQF